MSVREGSRSSRMLLTAAAAIAVLAPACSTSPTEPRCSGLDYSGTATVHGAVVYGAERVGGVSVTVGAKETVTAADGSFSISDVRPGPQALSVGPAQAGTAYGEVNAVRGDNLLLVPVVRGYSEGVLAGRAFDSCTGTPLAGVVISVAGRTATTTADGLYQISGLCCGTLPPLTATRSGYVPYSTNLGRLYNASRWLDIVMLRE